MRVLFFVILLSLLTNYSFCNSLPSKNKEAEAFADSIVLHWNTLPSNTIWKEPQDKLYNSLNLYEGDKVLLAKTISQIQQNSPSCIGKVRLYFYLALYQREYQRSYSAYDLLNEFISAANSINSLGLLAEGYRQKGFLLYKDFNKKDHQALNLFLSALDIRKNLGQKVEELSLLKDIADYHYSIGDENRAIKYYKRIIKEGNDKIGYTLIIDCWNAIGLIHRRNGEYEKAINYFNKAMKIAQLKESEVWVGLLNGNIGDTYFMQKKYSLAIPLLEQDLKSNIKYGIIENLSKVYKTLGEIYLRTNQLEKAEKYLSQSVNISQKQSVTHLLADTYLLFAELKEKQEDVSASVNYYKKSIEVKDLILNQSESKERTQIEIDRIYDLRDRKRHEEQLQRENDEKNLIIEKQKALNISIVFIVVVISIILGLLLRRNIKRKKVSQKLRKQYAIILEQKEEIIKFNEKLELEVSRRTQELKEINKQLQQYAFMNAHSVRGPLARILGLFYLLEYDLHETGEEKEIIEKAIYEAKEIDKIISKISRKLEDY